MTPLPKPKEYGRSISPSPAEPCVCVATFLPRVPYTCTRPMWPEFHTDLAAAQTRLPVRRRTLPNVCPRRIRRVLPAPTN
jgi:hypothetical protein